MRKVRAKAIKRSLTRVRVFRGQTQLAPPSPRVYRAFKRAHTRHRAPALSDFRIAPLAGKTLDLALRALRAARTKARKAAA